MDGTVVSLTIPLGRFVEEVLVEEVVGDVLRRTTQHHPVAKPAETVGSRQVGLDSTEVVAQVATDGAEVELRQGA